MYENIVPGNPFYIPRNIKRIPGNNVFVHLQNLADTLGGIGIKKGDGKKLNQAGEEECRENAKLREVSAVYKFALHCAGINAALCRKKRGPFRTRRHLKADYIINYN